MQEEILKKMKMSVNKEEYSHNKICISFVGGPGYGKSTIAKILCQKMNLFHTSTDIIRNYLKNLNIDISNYDKTTKLVSSIAYPFQDFLFKNKIDFVLDANLMLYLDVLRTRCKNYGYKLFIIEIEISKEEALRRSLKRLKENNPDNLSNSDANDFQLFLSQLEEYKKNEKPEYIFAKINVENDNIEKKLNEITTQIKAEIK